MTQAEFEWANGVRLVQKDELWEMRLAAWFLNLLPKLTRTRSNGEVATERRGDRFMQKFWTTWKRHPWGTIFILFPPTEADPMREELEWLREHELFHGEQMRTWWGWVRQALFFILLPLPFGLSGRWFIEREAYLIDLRAGVKTVDKAVELLWNDYGWIWPRSWMKAWFEEQLALEAAA